MVKMRGLYHTCGRLLLIYENPHRAMCPKHGLVTKPSEILVPDPKMDVDGRFFARRSPRGKRKK